MNCFRMVLATLEARAIKADTDARENLERGQPVAALIDEIVAAEMRGLATQVENAWKQERANDDT